VRRFAQLEEAWDVITRRGPARRWNTVYRRAMFVEIKAEARRRRQVASSSTDNAELGEERRRDREGL
jgi:hypothetical protein